MTRSVPGGTVWLCRCDPGQVGTHTSCFAAAEAECTAQGLQLWRPGGTRSLPGTPSAFCSGAPFAECRQCHSAAARRGFWHCSRSRLGGADAAGTALGTAAVTPSILPGVSFWLSGHLDHLWQAKAGVKVVTVHRKEPA